MLRKKTIKLLWTILLFLPFQSGAQDALSLEDMIQKSLLENYNLQIIRNNQKIAENQNTYGNAGFLPSVDMSSSQSWAIENSELNFFNGEGRTGENARSTSLNAMIETNWTVFDGFRMFARKDQLDYLAQLGELDTQYFIEQTIADLAYLYFQLITERQLLSTLRQSFEISSYRLDLEKEKRRVGSGNTLMYHQAINDLNADSVMVIRQKALIDDIRMRINRIMNQEPGNDFVPSENIETDNITIEDIETLISKAIENNFELEKARLNEMIAETNVRIEKAMRYPQINVFGNYAFGRQTSETGFVEEAQNYGVQYGVSIRFNLFNGNQQNIRIQNLETEKQNQQIRTEETSVMLKSELARILNQYQSAADELQLLEESMLNAEKSLEIAREQLARGSINGFEFRQNQLAVFQIQNQIVRLKYTLKIIETDLKRITGELIEWVL